MACNWTDIYAHSYQPEIVHDLVDSDEECYDDEDDSNDEGNWRNDYPDEESSGDRSSADSFEEDTAAQYRFSETNLGRSGEDGEDGQLGVDGFLDGSYWSRS